MRSLTRLQRPLRQFQVGRRWQSSAGAGSFFENTGSEALPEASAEESESLSVKYPTNRDLRSHPFVKGKLDPQGTTASQELLSPLKRSLYEKVLADNGGTYKNKQFVELDGKRYRLSLSREEQRALEPTVYIQSYRIKSSWKKMFMFLRMFRQMPLFDAITQCHFSSKRYSSDIAEMLERGRQDAIKLGLEPESLVVDQIWVGKDGDDLKRLHARGRGRSGIIKHTYVHVKAVLKHKSVIDQRQQWMKERMDRKLWMQLRNWKVKEDFVQTANYKW